MSDDHNRRLDPDDEGIKMGDHAIPAWWTRVFAATIVFSAVYLTYYHGGGQGRSEMEIYLEAQAALNAQRAKDLAASGQVDEETIASMAQRDPERGREMYFRYCAACHGEQGEGNIGPNLTDEYQIHGATRLDIYRTIRDGVPAKGMQSWQTVMGPEDLLVLTAYASALRGRNVAGKAPEGDAVSAGGAP